jgi:hypothetical protein
VNFTEHQAAELARARAQHNSIRSRHEGYAVILEEVRELEAIVFRRAENITAAAMLEELVQIAAMAQRMAEDLRLVSNWPSQQDPQS